MTGFLADLKHAIRVYRRTPVASLMAVVVFGVAMAFVGAFLSLYADLALRPHPGFDDSARLVTVGQNDGERLSNLSPSLIDRIDEEVTSIEAMSGYMTFPQRVGPDREQRVVEFVGKRFFAATRARLAVGRGFDELDHDPGAEPVAVISHRYWQERYGGSRDVIGEAVEITGRQMFATIGDEDEEERAPRPDAATTEFRIVGVMSEALPSLQTDDTSVWLPYEKAAPLYLGPLEVLGNSPILKGLGRLERDATPAAAAIELNQRYGDDEAANLAPGYAIDAIAGLVRDINVHRDAMRQLQLFLAGSMLIALVAASNVSLFLLSRAPGRRRELGIRLAVGAPMKRLARQLATEAGLLVMVATALGMLFSVWLSASLRESAILQSAQWRDVTLLDGRVLGIIIVFMLLLTVLVSLAPVLGLKRLGIAASSRRISTRANPTQRIASTVQIAIAGTVGGAAVAFGWYLIALLTADPGYDDSGINVVTLESSDAVLDFNADFEPLLIERERRREAVLSVPGVDAVGFASAGPGLQESALTMTFPRAIPPEDDVQLFGVSADPESMEMLGLQVAFGQMFDRDDANVMMANESGAELVWGRTDVNGESLPFAFSGDGGTEIVGVLADTHYGHPSADVIPRLYAPIMPVTFDYILVEGSLSPAELQARLQDLIEAGELEIAIDSVRRLDALTSELIAADTARSVLTIASATLVLILAAFGFYGTQRYLVTAGRREYAIHASLGAGPRALGRLVLKRGIALGLPGLVLGGLFAFIVVAWLRDDFVSREISPAPVSAVIVVVLIGLLLAAILGPARQARATQPAPLLREE